MGHTHTFHDEEIEMPTTGSIDADTAKLLGDLAKYASPIAGLIGGVGAILGLAGLINAGTGS